MDQAGGGVAVVWLANSTSTEVEQVQADLPEGTSVTYKRPDFSFTQLETDLDTTGNAVNALGQDGIKIERAELDLDTNRVAVFMLAPDERASARLRALGPSVDVRATESVAATKGYSRRTADGRAYGGRLIRSSLGGCTSSTSATAGGSYFVMTAGHCGPPQTAHTMGDISPTASIGVGRLKNQFYQQTRTACDCQLVGTIAQGKATNQVIVDGAGNLYSYGRLATDGDFYRGRPACASGYQSALRVTSGRVLCGQLGDQGFYVSSRPDGVRVTVDGPSWHGNNGSQLIPGDSGAPFGDGPTFLGIESGGDDTIDFFSRANLFQRATDGAPIFGNP